MNKDVPIIVFGAGSIGERHIKNLLKLGYSNLYVYRQRNLPLREVAADAVKIILDESIIPELKCAIAFICTPSSQHMKQTIACIRNDMHVFVEKPLSHNLDDFETLRNVVNEKRKCIQVAYMMRFHPLILKIKEFTENKNYGRLLSFHTHWGSSVTNWHSWENFRDSYASRKDLGGGVALTLSHDIDLVNWMVKSKIIEYKSEFGYYDKFDIDVESVADFLIRYENGVTGHVHLNYLEQEPKRKYEFIFEDATAEIDYFKAELKVITLNNVERITIDNFDRNELFVNEVQAFFNLIDDGGKILPHTLQQINESEQIIKMCMP
ncbi:MAG: Gfo/Idh/MocA family protein [Chitinophagales bacterium]